MKLPMLYKKTSTGAIQQWEIFTNDNFVNTKFGQVGGKIQSTSDLISKGKNIGKANETTPEQQAELEAKASWEKKKKSGYVESIADAQNDKTDDLIKGGVLPMLAKKYSEQASKIKYPCYTQPKLDGIRCIAIVKDGACTLWSRTRKQIKSCPHIVQELEAAFENKDIILDGELYNHDFKANFEHIVHLVRQDKKPDPQHTDVQYHVYDIINSDIFDVRTQTLVDLFEVYEFYSIKFVETWIVNDEDVVMDMFEKFREQGYEGAMLRNANSKYVGKRSSDLQKVKEFDDGEFKIIGIKEGRGKLAGHAIFICIDSKGDDFEAKLNGDTSKLKEYFDDHSLWKGKKLTVQYQGFTGAKKVPRFPIAIAVRDYE